MKKFLLCVLSVSLLNLSVHASQESVQVASSGLLASIKSAVQRTGNVLKKQVEKQQEVVANLIKYYSKKSLEKACNHVEVAKVAAKNVFDYVVENPQEAAGLVDEFVVNNRKALAVTALTAYITYKLLRAFTDLKPQKPMHIVPNEKMFADESHVIGKGAVCFIPADGYIKSAAKITTASLLSAAAAVFAWNKVAVS